MEPDGAQGVLGESSGERARGRAAARTGALFAETELLDHHPVALDVGGLQIVEQPASLTDHSEQPAPTVMVALVHLEVLRQVFDAFGQERDLDFRGPRVRLVGAEVIDNLALPLRCQRHRWSTSMTFPLSLDGRTLQQSGIWMQRSIWDAPRYRSTRGRPGTPVFRGPCPVLIHGPDERLGAFEDLVSAEPPHEARDEHLPAERLLAVVIQKMRLDPDRPRPKRLRASDVRKAGPCDSKQSIAGYVNTWCGQELRRVNLQIGRGVP